MLKTAALFITHLNVLLYSSSSVISQFSHPHHLGSSPLSLSLSPSSPDMLRYFITLQPTFDVTLTPALSVTNPGSPLWSKEQIKPIVIQEGASLVLPCRPPAGLPPPIIFWMDNSKHCSSWPLSCT